jgi:NAD(P)-dependent dehydrogenase (short-subunit alcohol dehydrogenase family)
MKAMLLAGACAALWSFAAPAAKAAETADRPTVLITGANRGIGLEFVRQLSARDWRIIATARRPDEAADLRALAAGDPDIVVEPLDVTDHAGVDALADKYRAEPIDVLLLNAALGPAPDVAMQRLAQLEFDTARQSFAVNAIGPMKVTQAFWPHVTASKRRQILVMSSDSGSFVAGSQRPILYHYKASKAALNMYFHTLAFEASRQGVTVVMLHPGLVGTNPMLAKFPGALQTSDSVRQLLAVIDGLTPGDNGRFIDYLGADMPW